MGLAVLDQTSRFGDAAQQIRSKGLKPTMGRLTVWRLREEATEPLSMQDLQRAVFESKMYTPFNTLYMALRQLEDKGLVRERPSRLHARSTG